MTLSTSARKHQYRGDGQCTSNLTRLDHAHAGGNRQPQRTGDFAGIGSRTTHFFETASSENISGVQYGIHTGQVVNQGFNVAAQIPGLLETFAYSGRAEGLTLFCAATGNFQGRTTSKKPVLADKQDFAVPHYDHADPDSMIIDEDGFPVSAERYIDSKDGLVTVLVLELLLPDSKCGHRFGSLDGKFYFNPERRGFRYLVSIDHQRMKTRHPYGKSSPN